MKGSAPKQTMTPAERVASAVAGTALDVALPDKGAAGSGTATPQPSGNAALDEALKDPTVQKGVTEAMLASTYMGTAGGLAVGFVAGAGAIGLLWAFWPKGKR